MTNSKKVPITEAKSAKDIRTKITSIRKSAATWNNNVQVVGLLIMRHAEKYGDCTDAARLLDAMPKSSRRALLQRWFQMFSPINVYVDTKTKLAKASFRKTEAKAFNKFNIVGAEKTPWFDIPEAQNEPDLKGLEDFNASFNAFMNRWEKMLKDDDKVQNEFKAPIETRLKAIQKAALEPVDAGQPDLPIG